MLLIGTSHSSTPHPTIPPVFKPVAGGTKMTDWLAAGLNYRFRYFSQLYKLPICTGKITDRIGKLTDIVLRQSDTHPYPEAVGLYIDHGWGKPNAFVPFDHVLRIEDDAIFVKAPEGDAYPPFVDQPGWLMINEHLMGRTILDMDGRRVEVVNDVHLLESTERMILVHVDVSFKGFLRKWGLGGLTWVKENLISWQYVQPLSVEDVGSSDTVTLSVTHKQLKELPSEDLADALEELSGDEQQALFSALDSEKAAETLVEAEPRAKRQIIANLRQERARTILSEMSVPQLADLFSVLPHNHAEELAKLLPAEMQKRIEHIMSERESTARSLMSNNYVAYPQTAKVGEVLAELRRSGQESEPISYIYALDETVLEEKLLVGVVDLRELILAADDVPLSEIMSAPVVGAEEGDALDDVAEMFAKYHFRLLPVVDEHDHILGVIFYSDIMKGLVTHAKV